MLSCGAGGVELAVAFQEDGLFFSGEFVGRGDISDGAVQPNRVVVLDIPGDEPSRIGQTERGAGPDALALEGLVKAFQLAVALGIIR